MKKRFNAGVLLLAVSFALLSVAQAQPPQSPCAPGISFWKLLDAVSVGYTDGRLSIGKLYAVCLPTPAKPSTSNYPYDPDGGGKLTTVVRTADGKVLNTYVWFASSIGGLWELSRYKVLGGYQSIMPLSAGNYSLEFAAEDKPFTRFPFSVSEMKNEDPYQPAGTRYFIEGAWNEYGNIFYQRNDPQSVLSFTTWVQEKRGSESKTFTPYEAKLINLKDGKALAEDAGSLKLAPRWLELKLLFHPAGGDKNAYLKAEELLREDGRYSVRLSIDGKPYGDYPFTVKGNRIQFQGKQVRENTDPMTFIVDYLSGGRYSSWWIKREPPAR
ncbi:MAG TPA: hypothetical protein VJU86_19860 [Pyrinomonadaceae bacterium]|nr:hypothetical protein [Pyrinomonadaceae bacterium]